MRTAPLAVAALALVSASRLRVEADAKSSPAVQLFNEARKLMTDKNFAAACPKLEESYKLDPAVGTTFNLALCYEKTDRLATAYEWYGKAADQATRAKQQPRVDFARQELARLDPQVPRLVVRVAQSVPGLTVTRSGASMAVATPVMVDAGPYEVSVTAPDHQAWKKSVTATAGQTTTVDVPALAPVVTEEPPPPPPPPPSTSSRRRTRLIIAASVGGGGIVLTGVGLVFGLLAKSSWDDARALCPAGSTSCSDAAVALGETASSRATASTVLTTVGIIGVGAGVVLYLTAPKREMVVVPTASAHGAGLVVMGRF